MEINYFKERKILITGITGFVGRALSDRLSSLGAIIYGISRSVNNDARNLNADILDYPKINKFIKDSKIKICFHLASKALVESGQENPYQTFKINTEGTLNILESARNNNLDRIIVASTSHVYGKNKVPYLESYMPRPTRPYETSKACTDLIAQSYADTFNLPVLIPRFVNIYGPNDLNFDRLIPKTIRSVLSNQQPKMWDGTAKRDYLFIDDQQPKMWDGTAKRDYLFIDDAIQAYLLLAKVNMKKVENNRVFNFGSSNIITVSEVIKKIIDISKKQLEIEKIDDLRMNEIKSQYVSWKKAKQLLGWEPKVDLDLGLKRTVAWYSRFLYNKR